MSQINRNRIVKEIDKNFIVEASAGSGKTTILVERMVALVEHGVKVNEIVALTFTKKAANEFYERFFAKLELRSRPGFKKEKDDEYSCLDNPTKEQQELDKEALKDIDTCFLGTIDSFVAVILKEHPIDAEIPSSSEIISDEDYTNILIDFYNRAVHGKITAKPELVTKAKFFDKYVGAKYFVPSIKVILSNRESKVIMPDDDINKIISDYQTKFNFFKAGLIELYEKRNDFRNNGTKDSIAAWDSLIKNIGVIRKLKVDDYKRTKYIFKSLTKLRVNKNDAFLNNALNNFLTIFMEYKEGKIKAYSFLEDKLPIKDIENIIYFNVIDFLKSSKDIVLQELHDQGKMSFKDAMVFATELIRKDKDEQHGVISKIRSKFKHYLIDEFQDDDLIQSELFFRITSPTIHDDWRDCRPLPGSLFFVGDPKQSIYHFRGADLSAYALITKHFEQTGIGEILSLDRNFRSKFELCRYYNEVFPSVFEGSLPFPEVAYGDPRPSKAEDQYKGTYYYQTGDEDPTNVSNIILDIKNHCVVNGEPVKFSDFMVITSSKANIRKYIEAFAKKKIPCFAEGAVNIDFSAFLTGIINLFKYLVNPEDKYAFVSLLASPLFNFDFQKTAELNPYLVKDLLGDFIDRSVTYSPSIYLESLLEKTQIYEILNYQGLDILIGIIALIKEAEMEGSISSYNDAIMFLDDLRDSSSIERMTLLGNTVDAVKIANVHKVKGLQSKVVILTKSGVNNSKSATTSKKQNFTDNEIRLIKIEDTEPNPHGGKTAICKTDKFSSFEEEEIDYSNHEEKRIIYVAGTRAKNIMFVAKPNKKGKWDSLIAGSAQEYIVPSNQSIDESGDTVDVNTLINKTSLLEDNISSVNKPSYKIFDASKQHSENKKHVDETEDTNISTTYFKNKEDALVFGTMVHKLMECIVKAKDIILDESIVVGIANDYERDDLIEPLEVVRKTIYSGGFKNQDEGTPIDIYKEIKDNTCYAETPYSYVKDNEVHYGIIDLIIEKENETLIIDYKTDSVKTDHTPQLEEYAEAYRTATGKKVSCYIYSIR